MARDVETILEGSVTFRAFSLVRKWLTHSMVAQLLADERVLIAGLGLFLLLSLVRVLTSTMGAPVKFLSFALLFVFVAALTWHYTDPRPDA
jgi:hypothetical protein